ncbi:MAG TPA: trypsin-like peptidase domain-containing protein [Caulifigura sp.]|jgi:serine protease Do|nr:trypsin-like peptidase domain-containing protein [Caulifigura sp.]
MAMHVRMRKQLLLLSTLGLAVALNTPRITSAAPDAPTPDTVRATLQEAGRELSKIAAQVSPAVVHIQSDRGRTEETGSGVLMRSPSYNGTFVVTNRHVVTQTPKQQINIRLRDGRVLHPESVLEDRYTDLAVLKVSGADLITAEWANSDDLEIGHFVLAVGSPFGLSQSVTMGIISAKSRRALSLGADEILNQDFLQTDAAINPGNSGGPLIDLAGRVVGINTAIASQGGGNEGIGFSIPSNLVKFVVEELLTKGEVKRGYLGVRLDDAFDEKVAQRYGLDRLRGARVVEVYSGTPAESAGLTENDIVLSFNGEDVEDENHLINRVSLTPIETVVSLMVLRKGRQVPLQIKLKERPPKRATGQRLPDPKSPVLPAGLETVKMTTGLSVQATGASRAQGLLVVNVPEHLRSSLRLYDIIVEAARQPVSSPEDLTQATSQLAADAPLLLKVRRLENGRTNERLIIVPR